MAVAILPLEANTIFLQFQNTPSPYLTLTLTQTLTEENTILPMKAK